MKIVVERQNPPKKLDFTSLAGYSSFERILNLQPKQDEESRCVNESVQKNEGSSDSGWGCYIRIFNLQLHQEEDSNSVRESALKFECSSLSSCR